MQSSLRHPLMGSELELVQNIQQAIFPPKPRSFAALMEMYEINYMQMRLLCGDIRRLTGDYCISTQNSGIPVKISILEQSNHTTILLMTYDFGGDEVPRPDLHIQIYHDSKQANVISKHCKFLGSQVNTLNMNDETQLLCQWRSNRFLFKWVKYLRRQEYRF